MRRDGAPAFGGSSITPAEGRSRDRQEMVYTHRTMRGESARVGAGGAGLRCSSSGRMAASATAALLVALLNLLASNGALAQQVGNLTCETSNAG